ncbi:MAG: glycosyltransferase [Candidatus Parcubacteria bacterium]|nr:glycosyltransferase [Burkholderiales bacterium]
MHVVSSLDPAFGGVAEAVRQYCLAAQRTGGHAFEVATLDAPGAPWLAGFPALVHALGPGHTNYCYAPRLAPWLRGHLAGYDAAVSHGIWQHHGLAVRAAARRHHLPYFVFVHGMLDPWFNRRFPVKHLKKRLFWSWSVYPVMRDAAGVIYTAEEEAQLAPLSFLPYAAQPLIAPLGIEPPPGEAQAQRGAFAEAFPQLAGKPFLLYLGRIHAKKGIDVLISSFARAMKASPELRLVIAGPDAFGLRPALERLARRECAASRIHWVGELRGELKWGALRSAEAFVLSSHMENFGIAVVEALACGTPVLISNRVYIWREIAADGAALVGADDVQGYSATLDAWRELEADGRAQMRRRALRCYETRFSPARAYSALCVALDDGMGRHGVRYRNRPVSLVDGLPGE